MMLFCCFLFSQQKVIKIPELENPKLFWKEVHSSQQRRKIVIPKLLLKKTFISDSIKKIVVESNCFKNLEKIPNSNFYLLMHCKYEESKQNCIEISILPMPKYKKYYTLFDFGYNKINGFFDISNVHILVSDSIPSKLFKQGPKYSLKIEITPPYFYDVPSWTFLYTGDTIFLLYNYGCQNK